jgi:hypothetical protein
MIIGLRIAAGIFSAIALWALVRLLNLEFHFIPMPIYGVEGGLIELALDMMFGSIAALAALVLAVIHLRLSRGSRGAKWLVGWCGLLVVAYLGVFIGNMLAYRRGQSNRRQPAFCRDVPAERLYEDANSADWA